MAPFRWPSTLNDLMLASGAAARRPKCSTLLFEKRVQCFHNLRVFFVPYRKEKVLETTLVRPRVGGGYLGKLESFFIRQVL